MSRKTLGALAACWLAAVGFITLASWDDRVVLQAGAQFERLCRAAPVNQVGRGACARLAATAPPLTFDPDAYAWISLTQRQADLSLWRSHAYPFDNAPYGRKKHWSSSLNWWLLLVGQAERIVTGESMDAAIADASLWANPALFALFLLGVGLAFQKIWGGARTGILLITLASLWGVQWDFSYGRPDHHGLHLIAFIGMVCSALAGGFGWNANASARRWFIASALFGAMGLWIGSTQQCIGIAAVGAGALLAMLVFRKSRRPFDAGLWRLWGRVGAVASLGFFLLEYFPREMGMRLEINHPLYALAWWGGGELIWTAANWKSGSGRQAAMACAAIVALPVTIALGPPEWCVMRDPWLAHVFGLMTEGLPWIQHPSLSSVSFQIWIYTGTLMLAVPLAAYFARRRPLALALLPMTLGFIALTLLQSRWMGFMESSLAILAVTLAPDLPRLRGGALPLGLLALTFPGWAANFSLHFGALSENPIDHARATLIEQLAVEEFAWNLSLRQPAGQAPLRVMAPAGPSPLLYYFGGVHTVGSFYWENLEGSRATLDFFNDSGDAVARRIARERGIDYVMVISRPDFVMELQTLRLGKQSIDDARRTLAFRLANPLGAASLPDWLEPAPLQDAPIALNRGLELFRVRKERLGE